MKCRQRYGLCNYYFWTPIVMTSENRQFELWPTTSTVKFQWGSWGNPMVIPWLYPSNVDVFCVLHPVCDFPNYGSYRSWRCMFPLYSHDISLSHILLLKYEKTPRSPKTPVISMISWYLTHISIIFLISISLPLHSSCYQLQWIQYVLIISYP